MAAGRFDTRVKVQRATETVDAHGGVVSTWATVGKRWAAVEPLSAREIFTSDRVASDANVKVTLREAVDSLDSTYRFVTEDAAARTLNVEQPVDGMRKQYSRGQECICKETVN